MNIQEQLITNQKQIKLIKEKYKAEKELAAAKHKAIVQREKEELGDLEKQNAELKAEILENDDPLIDGLQEFTHKALMVNPKELPREYLEPNMKKIRAEMRASEYTKPIKGVKVINEKLLKVLLQ